MSSKDVRSTGSPDQAALHDAVNLGRLTVRDLLRELARLEDELHDLRRTAAGRADPVPDPAHQQLLLLERAVILELRSRRSAVRSAPPPQAGRPHSAAWPPPPWS